MDKKLINSDIVEIVAEILEQPLLLQDVTPPVIFTTAVLSVLVGVLYADNVVKIEETQRLNNIINRLFPPSSKVVPFSRLILKGVQKVKIYNNLEAFYKLTSPFNESEKLLLISFGYEMSTADGDMDLKEKGYLQLISNNLEINIQYLNCLELIFTKKQNIDQNILEKIKLLLNPALFQELDPIFVHAAQHIFEQLPKTAIKIQEKRINQRQTSNKSYQQLKEFQKYKKQLDNYCHELYQIISDCQKRNFIRNNLLEEITKISRKIQSQEFRIAVVGEFSQGKSTLLNALLGEEIQPVREIPCSGVITVLKYGKEKRVICCYKDGTKEEISYSLYQEKASITEDIALGSLSEGLEKSNLKEIIFEHPNLDLCSSGVVIIDSPGLNEHPDRTSITEKLIEGTDAVIFLTNASRLLTQGERELIEDLKNKLTGKYNQPAENLFIVVNFCDLIRSEKGLQQVEERVKRFVLGEKPLITGNNRIHFLSSQLALDAILNQTENKYLIKFQDFTKSLEHFLIIERGSLEVKKIINKLNSLIQSIEAELKETEGILEGKVHLSESEKINILEQIGEISGVYYRIMETGEVLTKITIDEVTNSWNKWVENLDNRLIEKSQYWESDHSMFWDQEKVIKDYQDCFFRDLKEELSKWENQYFISILKKKLDFLDNYIRAEFQTIQENIEDINIKNHNISNKLSNQINTTISNIETEFVLGGIHIGAGAILGGILGLAFPLGWGILGSSAIGALLGWFGGEHDREKERNIKTKVFELGINRFTESLEQIFPEIDSKIESIFNERMELTRKAIDETIFIYESLLEKQDKFYQETLEQRQTEQNWINLKQQEIDQINTKIEKLFFSI